MVLGTEIWPNNWQTDMSFTPPTKSSCFTKNDLRANFNKSTYALDAQIKRALKNHKLLQLKKGLYVSSATFFNEKDKTKLNELLASQIHYPSYISLEYALHHHDLLSQTSNIVTSVTPKQTKFFKNHIGNFKYTNLKKSFYFGFEEQIFRGHSYQIATKAKALFDYLYLKSGLPWRNLKKLKYQLLEKSGILWENFSKTDFQLFDQYVWKSNSKKMMRIRHVISGYFAGKDFDEWKKELFRE